MTAAGAAIAAGSKQIYIFVKSKLASTSPIRRESAQLSIKAIHCKKKVNDLPVPSRDVTNQTLSGQEKLNYSPPGRVW